jgi:arginine exporter protein ArgO
MTILSFAGIFAGLGVGSTSGNYVSAAVLVAGVFIGSALWWLILSSVVGLFGRNISSQKLRWINRISGTIITAFGVLALLSL